MLRFLPLILYPLIMLFVADVIPDKVGRLSIISLTLSKSSPTLLSNTSTKVCRNQHTDREKLVLTKFGTMKVGLLGWWCTFSYQVMACALPCGFPFYCRISRLALRAFLCGTGRCRIKWTIEKESHVLELSLARCAVKFDCMHWKSEFETINQDQCFFKKDSLSLLSLFNRYHGPLFWKRR